MAYCRECGAEVSESQNFCNECGTEIVVEGSAEKGQEATDVDTEADKIGFKTAVRIVGQYYSEHQLRLFIHIVISITTVGIWSSWFLGVMYYVYTGPSEGSRIGSYMIENNYGEYVGKSPNTGVMEEYDDWEEKKTHPDESPSVIDATLAVVRTFPSYYKDQPFIAILHLALILSTGGVFLLYYPARVAYIWFGTPIGPRTQQYLENNGYTLVSKESN